MGLDAGSLALLSGGLGAASSLGGAYAQSRALRTQGKYESQQLGFNARMADLQAEGAERRGQEDAKQIQRERARILGAQRASAAGQGVVVDAGSALAGQEETAYFSGMDLDTAAFNAFSEAWGHRAQGTGYRQQSRMTRLAGKNASRSTLITGGINAANALAISRYNYERYRTSAPAPYTSTNRHGMRES